MTLLIVHDLPTQSEADHVVDGRQRHGGLGGIRGDDDLDFVLIRLDEFVHLVFEWEST